MSNIIYSNTVYGAFHHILKSYDGLNGNKVDYTNLPDTRGFGTWRVGRQIWERKGSFEYLKELCKQSFVGIVPARDGRLILKAWRQQGDPYMRNIPVFNENTIIRDSIKNFAYTEPQSLYNDFKINYMYNSGREKFDKCLFVTNADRNEFPKIDGNWTTFVGGISFNPNDEESIKNAYEISKWLWQYAREGRKFAGKFNSAPQALTNLYWCVGYDYALNYLMELIRWTSLPKAQVEFSIPLNGYIHLMGDRQTPDRNIKLELLDQVFFKDLIYTDGGYFVGYITKIEINIKKSEIKLNLIFEPEDYSNLIIERGIPHGDPWIVEYEDEDDRNGDLIVEGVEV